MQCKTYDVAATAYEVIKLSWAHQIKLAAIYLTLNFIAIIAFKC